MNEFRAKAKQSKVKTQQKEHQHQHNVLFDVGVEFDSAHLSLFTI